MVDDVLVYLGECEILARRFNAGYGNISPRNCFVGGQSTNCKVNRAILCSAAEGKKIGLWFHTTAIRKQVESRLIEGQRPPWNG